MYLRHLLDLVLPAECASCRAPGTPWCLRCDAALRAGGSAQGARRVRPDPAPEGLPDIHAWAPYAGPLRPAITAWKDEGRGDLRPLLGRPLRVAMRAALAAAGWVDGPVLVIPVPSSRASLRRRGEAPLARLVSEALRGHEPGTLALRPVPAALAAQRGVADQAGLGVARRAENLRHAFVVPDRWRPVVHGRRCLLVDDIVTTGATLVEGARALHAAGAHAVVAATIAATQRHGAAGSGSRS